VLWIGTVTTPLQLGHGAVMLIWSRVAERCWPHVGHANLMSAAFLPCGKTRGPADKVIRSGIVIISLQLEVRCGHADFAPVRSSAYSWAATLLFLGHRIKTLDSDPSGRGKIRGVVSERKFGFASSFGCRLSSKKRGTIHRVRYWEIIADNLSKAGWNWAVSQRLIPTGERSLWPTRIVATVQRFVVHADEKPTAFLELERAICLRLLSEQI